MSSFNMSATPQTRQLRQASQLGSRAVSPQPTNASPNTGNMDVNQPSELKSTNPSSPQHSHEVDLNQAVKKLNQQLMQSNLKVEVDQKEPTNQIWLNVVDKTTGQVILRLPPEGLRQSVETQLSKGMSINQKT